MAPFSHSNLPPSFADFFFFPPFLLLSCCHASARSAASAPSSSDLSLNPSSCCCCPVFLPSVRLSCLSLCPPLRCHVLSPMRRRTRGRRYVRCRPIDYTQPSVAPQLPSPPSSLLILVCPCVADGEDSPFHIRLTLTIYVSIR